MGTARTGVEVEGARELRRAMARMDASLDDLKATHRQVAELVEARAEDIAPVLTGTLRDSTRVSVRKTGASVLAGRSRIPYAGVIHFGWPAHGIEPQPFLYDALDDRREAVADAYSERVAALVRRLDIEAP